MSPKLSEFPQLNDTTTRNTVSRPEDDRWNRVPDDQNGACPYISAEKKLEEEETNPWRNHEDDRSKWLGLLLAAVGLGAIGYLISAI